MTKVQGTNLDDRLADFTDRLMAGDTLEKPAASDSDRDLASLKKTVEQARRVFHAAQPDTVLRNHIRARLAAEWHKSGPQAQNKNKDWLSPGKKNRAFLLRLAAMTAALVILAGFVAPKIDTVLPGAAQNKGGVALIVGVVLVILVLILFWPPRKP